MYIYIEWRQRKTNTDAIMSIPLALTHGQLSVHIISRTSNTVYKPTYTHTLSTFQPVLSLIPWSFGQYHKMFNILHSIYSLQTFWWINFLIMKPKNSSRDFWCRLSNLPRFTFDVDFHLNKQRSSRSSSSSNRSTNNSTQFSSTVFSRLIESLKTLANNRLYNCCYIYAVWFHPKIDDCFFSYHRFQCGNRKNQIEFD